MNSRVLVSVLGLSPMVVAQACGEQSRGQPGDNNVATSSASIGSTVEQEFPDDALSPTDPLPPGARTSSRHSDAWKIRNALAAAPATISERATVMDWPSEATASARFHGRVLRQGDNGWVCMPDTIGKPQHDPMCMDETMMKWMTATMAGKKPNIDRVGLSYMLLGEIGADLNDYTAKEPPPGKDWYRVGPHVMVVLPDDVANAALRHISGEPSTNEPYVRTPRSPSPLLVIPVAKAGEMIRAFEPKAVETK